MQIRLRRRYLCSVLDDNGKSIPHSEMALDLAETLGEQRLLSDSLFGYADCLHRGQRYADATGIWSRCIEQQKQNLRTDHPELALSLDGFALSLRQLNQPNAAIPLHLKAQSIYHESLPPYHPALGASYHGLSQALLRCGQVHQAVRHMRLALRCAEHNLPPDHPDIAITAFELGRAELSIGLGEVALKENERRPPNRHSHTRCTASNGSSNDGMAGSAFRCVFGNLIDGVKLVRNGFVWLLIVTTRFCIYIRDNIRIHAVLSFRSD